MTGVWLAAASAALWGAADYCGGRAARYAEALAVTVLSQIIAFPVLMVAVIGWGGRPRPGDLAWGALAGLAGLLGIVLLYQGLAGGAMVAVAPITAVTAALVPLTVGLVQQQLPSALALSGACCAVAAIGLVSLGNTGGSGTAGRSTVVRALTAGAMFGIFFALLAQTGEESGAWPVMAMRLAGIAVGSLAMIGRRIGPRMPRATVALVAVTGIGDTSANVLYLIATREGLLSVVAPIAALYPVSTVLLALAVDRERVRAVQIAGLGLAAIALVLTAG